MSEVDTYMFPSPVGELHFSMDDLSYEPIPRILFPSPVGELHFSIGGYKNEKI